ncbi:helix-turn-helix transcriptional regulator [Paraburkholderia phymatum]|uniref:Transcriptional regulator, AraC family n=1 Tax=Paraburkholderia phymatum (strain DSM 17167 / CIP 108236 / LMG 21445 / STM815) TaxID=391038 RepID=B2JT57_PARP8|nr:helix-turn-helix transcriptional regulator [Paraburkholderia phymatum]ACC75760.1 transcriptional regulator, AraC family [Paraburkholderia phymatum STM815]
MSNFEGKDSALMTEHCWNDLNALPVARTEALPTTVPIPVEPAVDGHVHLIGPVAGDAHAVVSANHEGMRLLLRPFSCRLLASVVEQGPPPYEMFVEGWLSTSGTTEHSCTQAVQIHFRFGERIVHTQRDSTSEEAGIPERIHGSATFLKSNLEHVVTVADVARTVAMSERNFLRRFRQEFGITPSEYLLQTRLQKSCQLLLESELPVDKIARRCGMTSGTRLAKIFRKRFGMSPTEYRFQNGKHSRALTEA